jgi:hypothetical protein
MSATAAFQRTNVVPLYQRARLQRGSDGKIANNGSLTAQKHGVRIASRD